RDAGGELPDGGHLLGLDELALESLAVGDVDADELHPAPLPVLDVAGVGEHGDGLAAPREQMEIVAAGVAVLERRSPQRGGPAPLEGRMDLLEGAPRQLLARVAEQAF